MKNKSPLALKPSHITLLQRRSGGIMDTLVFMLVAILLPVWILGTIYLSFYPASASASGATGSTDSQLVGNADDTSSALSADATENQDASQGIDGQDADGSNFDGNGSGGDFNPGQSNVASGLTADQTAAFDEKIKQLQQQLDAKSQEADQLRKDSMAASMSNSTSTIDTSKFENQITKLTQERDQLKMKLASADQSSEKMTELNQQIQTLQERLKSQMMENQTLQGRLGETEEAKRDVEIQLAAAKADLATMPEDPSPALAESTSINQPLEFREWLSSRGSKARLAFVGWEDDRVIVVNEAGKKFRLTLNRLSLADQQYVNGKR